MLPRRMERTTQGLSRDKLQVLVKTVMIYSKMLSWHLIRQVVPRAATEQMGVAAGVNVLNTILSHPY